MEDIFLIIIQIILEVLLNIFTIFPVEWSFYIREREDTRAYLRCSGAFLGGFLIGGLSLHMFPKTLISIPYLRIPVLILSPIATGFLSKTVAEFIHKRKADVWPERHFWYGFWICLGYVATRFVGAMR